MSKTNRKRCFVIMPFSKTSNEHTKEYWTKHFETFLKPLIEECAELEAYRSEPLRGDILRQIISGLVVSAVVVADLTDGNPNVFWELGVRQSFKHGTVTIAEQGIKIPFDISVKATLFYYPKDHIKNAKFIKQFKRAIMHCLSHPDSPDSHVLESISGRGSLFEIIHRDEAARRVEALISESTENFKVLNKVYDAIPLEFVTERLRSSSVELLITHRYLDEKSSFYKIAETYSRWVLSINQQLALWEHFDKTVEKWLLDEKQTIYEIFKGYKKQLERVRKKLFAL